jgi:hypothetical protein
MDGVSDIVIRVGRLLFAIAMAFFGMQCIIFARGGTGLVPGPPWTQGHVGLAWIAGIGFILAAVCLASRWQGRVAANVLGLCMLAQVLFFYLPRLATHIHDPRPWTSGFEVLALSGASFVLARTLPDEVDKGDSGQLLLTGAGRYMFAIALVVFGAQHLLYAPFVATLMTPRIPGHLFWAYFVGVAFFVAAMCIGVGKKVRLAGIMLGAMFLLFVVLLHVPRMIAAPHNGNEWTSGFIALACGGASFVLAGALQERKS